MIHLHRGLGLEDRAGRMGFRLMKAALEGVRLDQIIVHEKLPSQIDGNGTGGP